MPGRMLAARNAPAASEANSAVSAQGRAGVRWLPLTGALPASHQSVWRQVNSRNKARRCDMRTVHLPQPKTSVVILP